MGGLPKGAQLSPRALAMLNDLAVVQFRAERAGIDHPTERAAVTRDDFEALHKAIVADGASDDIIAKLFSNPGLQAASVEDQCNGSVLLYRGAGGYAARARRARMYSSILMAVKGLMQKSS